MFTFDTKIAGTGTASDCQSHGIFSTIKSQLLDNYTALVSQHKISCQCCQWVHLSFNINFNSLDTFIQSLL